MDKRRLILIVLLVVLIPFLFFQLRNLGAKPATPAPEFPQLQPQMVEQVEYSDVLVAATDIPYGTRLNESHLSWKQWPADAVSPNHVTKNVEPQAMETFLSSITKSDFFAGDPISKRKLVMAGEKSVMSALLNPGMRAVTTRISVDTAAGGFIKPGDNVDIILTSSVQGLQGGGSKRFVSQTIFENVRILAIDQIFSNSAEGGSSIVGSTATFEMTQDDAEMLSQSVAQGDLSLTLRPLGRGAAPGKSHASVKRNTNEVSHLTIYRDGQPQQVAIRGQ